MHAIARIQSAILELVSPSVSIRVVQFAEMLVV